MSQNPLASVCIPLFNKKNRLAKTLEVILAQTYSPLEVVISDNGSTDGSGDIAREFAHRDPRVRYFRLEHTVNINESFRYCCRLAKGEFINWHSADDANLQPDFLQRMIEPMLRHSDTEFTFCAAQSVVEYTDTGVSQAAQAGYFLESAQFCRELTALRHRPDRARKLFEGTAHRNLLGTIYAVVWRRCCIPEAHWAKCKSAYAWPETYPDWDFLVRLFLNHRGHFVHDASVLFHYDANSPVSRFIVDNRQDLLDAVAQMLLPLSVLIDPDLADLRQQARAEELAQLLSLVQTSISTLMDLSDEVVAFDHPHFAAKLLPRLHQYIEVFRRNPFDWIAARRVRQLRFGLARHWLAVDHGVVRQEYLGPHGEVHRLLLQSGIRKAKLDVREKELLQKTRAELATPLPQSAGHWLALALLGDLRSMPEFTLDKVPDWLRPDFAKYPLAD